MPNRKQMPARHGGEDILFRLDEWGCDKRQGQNETVAKLKTAVRER